MDEANGSAVKPGAKVAMTYVVIRACWPKDQAAPTPGTFELAASVNAGPEEAARVGQALLAGDPCDCAFYWALPASQEYNGWKAHVDTVAAQCEKAIFDMYTAMAKAEPKIAQQPFVVDKPATLH